jgi:alpha-beta hydrolase superfamily lysophospholipase
MLLQALTEYFKGNLCHLYLSPAPGVEDRREIVVLVHGLLRRSYAFYSLGRKLSRLGYTVCVYDYRTTRKLMPEHGVDLKKYLERIAVDHPDMKINMVTHSMGGILTRLALGHLMDPGTTPDDEILSRDRFNRIVMLAPPHHGSDLAKRLMKYLPALGKLIKPLPGLSSAPEAAVHQFPVPKGLEIGIIAGRFDSEVALPYTYLPGANAHIVIKSEHSFMMYMPAAIRAVISFLATGHF